MVAHRTVDLQAGATFASAKEEKSELREDRGRVQTIPMKGPLQVLILEDSENDAALLELELQQAGYETICQRVETAAGLRAALAAQSWDVVIADYVMPQFSGLSALAIVAEAGLDIPFIIVSGHITEDTAVAAMKAGAHDYVMKDKLARLGPAVERELREAEMRRQRKRIDETLKVEHAITRVLANAESLDEAAPGIVQLLLDGLEADAGLLWIADVKHQIQYPFVINLRNRSTEMQIFLEESRRLSLPRGVGLPGRVWDEGRAVWVSDWSEEGDLDRREAGAKAGLCSAMAFPIQSNGEFVGALEFFASRKLEHDPSLLNMMTAIGSEIGQFIKRRRAEEGLRRAHDELEMRVQQRTAELKQANTKLHTAIAERNRLEHELLDITERERRRIGLDLHDDLGQKLSGVALMLKGLERRLSKQRSPEVKEAAGEAAKIHNLVQQAMNHASDLAHDLATIDVKQNNLPDALSDLAAHVKELFEISCKFKVEGTIAQLEPGTINQMYKIAQEAVTNAIKHGKAKKVDLSLANGSEKVVLKIKNDGLPFPDLESRSTGMGLKIMNYRASIIGASLEIKGTGASGTLVTCSLPVESKK
jgi:two-component system, NarL family, sensor histidine kinase UhpB